MEKCDIDKVGGPSSRDSEAILSRSDWKKNFLVIHLKLDLRINSFVNRPCQKWKFIFCLDYQMLLWRSGTLLLWTWWSWWSAPSCLSLTARLRWWRLSSDWFKTSSGSLSDQLTNGAWLLIIFTSEGFPFFYADLPEQKRFDILQEMEFQWT